MTNRGTLLAAAAAAAFALGAGNSALATHHEAGEKIHCEGVNACKGTGGCKTAQNECGGLNSCKGKGWVSMTKAECDAAKKAAKS
jgi:hypothetical protein